MYIAGDGKADPITPDEIYKICSVAEWVEFDDWSDTPAVINKLTGLHPLKLTLGYGDLLTYCRTSGKDPNSKCWYFTGYDESKEKLWK